MQTIYIEFEIKRHPRTLAILALFPKATKIYCRHYGEVFNHKAQSFRLQKKRPALILAKKQRGFVLPVPAAYGIGAAENYYFSHMMNCPYDCRYCFLQGMYRSAHYVLFVNYENFAEALKDKITQTGNVAHFFSGYDCDSLALDPISKFLDYFLPLFREQPNTLLEIRTKSTQIRTLLDLEPLDNCVLAWSFTPAAVAASLEHGVPKIERRIDAIRQLQQRGWRIGLRFDPLIYCDDYQSQYRALFKELLSTCRPELLHSVTLGAFRLPKPFFKTLRKMHPREPLFASPLTEDQGLITYKEQIRNEMTDFCRREILRHIPENIFFLQEKPESDQAIKNTTGAYTTTPVVGTSE